MNWPSVVSWIGLRGALEHELTGVVVEGMELVKVGMGLCVMMELEWTLDLSWVGTAAWCVAWENGSGSRSGSVGPRVVGPAVGLAWNENSWTGLG